MEKKPTVKDVAKAAGVSVATVSYIMNNRTDQKISEQTRKKVLQIANLLNYAPSHAAKTLATGRNNIIGVSYHLNESTPSRNLEITGFVNLIIERLNRLNYDVLFLPLRAVEDNLPINRNIDGILTIDLSHNQFVELADNYMVPIVNIDMIINDSLFYQIYSDYPRLINQGKEILGNDCYLIMDKFDNANYGNFITSEFDSERIIYFQDCTKDELLDLRNKKALIIGTYLTLMVKPYLDESNIVVISSNETNHILPDEIKVIYNDISKKANLAINILMNAIDKKFDVSHDYKV